MNLPALPPMDHAPTSEEMRLRVVAQTNGENAAAGQRAMGKLFLLAERRKQQERKKYGA